MFELLGNNIKSIKVETGRKLADLLIGENMCERVLGLRFKTDHQPMLGRWHRQFGHG
jgi:hypothetical protein